MLPLVSIVLSTYNRPETLRLAIASVQAQSLQDWELLVVGDACAADTSALIASYADSRIHYINLVQNYGEQSGPNNLGVARAQGRYIAYLNHDDLWLPEHLQAALEWLHATGADMVFPLTAVVMPCTPEELAHNRWRTHLHGLGRAGRFDPVDTFAPASSWLIRREVAERVGPWRAAADSVTESSREWLFRAWRLGLDLRALPWVSVLAFHSGLREQAYVTREAHEQEWFWEQIQHNPSLRTQLLARAGNPEHKPRAHWQHLLLRLLASAGVSPVMLEYRVRGLGRGQLIDGLRERRGLPARVPQSDDWLAVRSRALHNCPAYNLGESISFQAEGNATAFQTHGWSYPEAWGTWTDGPQAGLSLRLSAPVSGVVLLEFEAQCYITEHCPSQRVSLHQGETWLGEWTFDYQNNHGQRQVRIPLNISAGRQLQLQFRLPDARAPASINQGSDARRLGLALVSLRLTPASP